MLIHKRFSDRKDAKSDGRKCHFTAISGGFQDSENVTFARMRPFSR